MRQLKSITYLCFIFLLVQCQPKEEGSKKSNVAPTNTSSIIKYAKGFETEYFEDYTLVTINQAWKTNKNKQQYVLYQHEKPNLEIDATFFKIPITSIACMSLTHVAFLEKLGVENSIVGISGCDYVNSPKVNKRIAHQKIGEIGKNQQVNYEFLVEKSPDLVMAFGINSSSNGTLKKMKELGLKVVINSEYMETHPLGKAEWIKFVAAFYNKNDKADSLFNYIEEEYNSLLELTEKTAQKPTVFTGMPWGGNWYVPGGKSFQAQLLKDAGASYLWQNNDEQSSLIKSKELIIDEAYQANFWLNQDSYKNVGAIVDYDQNFEQFEAVKKQQLYNNDKRLNVYGGNDYWESGVVHPHWVLKDLIKIFHPNAITHELYYYRRLEE